MSRIQEFEMLKFSRKQNEKHCAVPLSLILLLFLIRKEESEDLRMQ